MWIKQMNVKLENGVTMTIESDHTSTTVSVKIRLEDEDGLPSEKRLNRLGITGWAFAWGSARQILLAVYGSTVQQVTPTYSINSMPACDPADIRHLATLLGQMAR